MWDSLGKYTFHVTIIKTSYRKSEKFPAVEFREINLGIKIFNFLMSKFLHEAPRQAFM